MAFSTANRALAYFNLCDRCYETKKVRRQVCRRRKLRKAESGESDGNWKETEIGKGGQGEHPLFVTNTHTFTRKRCLPVCAARSAYLTDPRGRWVCHFPAFLAASPQGLDSFVHSKHFCSTNYVSGPGLRQGTHL